MRQLEGIGDLGRQVTYHPLIHSILSKRVSHVVESGVTGEEQWCCLGMIRMDRGMEDGQDSF